MKIKLIAAVILLLVVGSLAGIKALQIGTLIAAGKSFTQPPETVSVVAAREEKWQSTRSAIGSITAVQGVIISPEIAGIVREIAFESGAMVKQGELLVRLDDATERAQLAAIEAQVALAQLNFERVKSLRQEKTVAQAELDTAEATLKQYQANADAIRATIAKKTIRAPFAGQLGVRQVNLGQYLDPGKPIVSLQALDTVYADFSLPQQELAVLRTGMQVNVTTDTYPGQRFSGTLTTINPDLDPNTRSVGLQAALANPGHLLRPGMFGRMEVVLPEVKTMLVIPATSVLSAPYGDSVYVIESRPEPGGKAGLAVRQQFIRIGSARGDFLSVESGLKPGDRIVSSGVFKLRNGMAVVENNELAPKASETPRPADS